MSEKDRSDESEANDVHEIFALLRYQLSEMESECGWLWNDELTRLSDLPPIEDRDLPGPHYPSGKTNVTDRERACYLLGKIQAYSQAGTHIEAVIESVDRGDVSEDIVEEYGDPVNAFTSPEDKRDPEFNNEEAW